MSMMIDYAKTLASASRSAGPRSVLRYLMYRQLEKRGWGKDELCFMRPHQAAHPLCLRLAGSSDLEVFYQIFILEEYKSLRDLKNVHLVIDAGANVGLSSAYFLSCFPQATVVSLEPDPANCEACRWNLRPYDQREGRSVVVEGAVWSHCTSLSLSSNFADGRDWARQVVAHIQGETEAVQAWDLNSILERQGGRPVDLLKVDIEGAELSVFGETAQLWLDKVRNICIELHGPECREVFLKSLKNFRYDLSHAGELTICRNLRRSPLN
jgi:FkbM family methyltransferase